MDSVITFVALFFAGAFLCNCIPHLTAGLQGQSFPTPFARPYGVGNSTPLVNFLWGAFNVCVGGLLLANQKLVIGLNIECLAFAAGALALGIRLSRRFGKVRGQSDKA